MVAHPSWVEVDLGQLRRNIRLIKGQLQNTRYCLPIKANAYGHGLCAVGRVAQEEGVDYLAVAHLQEGVSLREAGIVLPILVLGAIHEEQIPDLIHYGLEISISSQFKANLVAQVCASLSVRCKVHVEVDTGMQRTGVRTQTAPALFTHLRKLQCFDVVGIYSHFASADDPSKDTTELQIQSFVSLLKDPVFQGVSLLRHCANSGGSAFFSVAHMDMVRPALVTFGYPPPRAVLPWSAVAPCFSLKSKVAYVKSVEAGVGISYGHTYITPKATRIVTIPVGYGDGYRRMLSNKAQVLIRGKKFPVVGNICMDQCMVDVGGQEVYVGEEVVLIGSQENEKITLEEISTLCETIPYEVLCFFGDRLPRVYLG